MKNNDGSNGLHSGFLTDSVRTEKTDMCVAFDNAQDVAIARHVLLQISNWFKSKHKQVPFMYAEPFNDEVCNEAFSLIVECMKKEQRDEELHRG